MKSRKMPSLSTQKIAPSTTTNLLEENSVNLDQSAHISPMNLRDDQEDQEGLDVNATSIRDTTCCQKRKSQLNSDNPNPNSQRNVSHRRTLKDCHLDAKKPFSKTLMMTLSAEDCSKWDSLMRWTVVALIFATFAPMIRGDDRVGLANNWERPGGMPKIKNLEVMCGARHMEVHMAFDKPFHGLVTSKGMYGHQDCIYVPPRSGKNEMVFNIYYDKCGTKPDSQGKFYENTVVVQYDEELIEAWDEAKRLRCEWFNDYEKTATKTSPMVISDLEVVELNFHGDNVDCWMEIQEGKGPWAPPLNGIAPLGSTLTMVIAVKDPSGEFDMRVKDCEASDGQTGRALPLSDPEGCIIRPKLLGKFSKVKLDDGRATVLTYAFISAFKFPDMLNVHLRCTVEICRHGCPDHCTGLNGPGQGQGNLIGQYTESEPVAAQSQNSYSKARPNQIQDSDESGVKNDLNLNDSPIKNKPDIHNEALQNHNLGHQHQNHPQSVQHVHEIPRFPAQNLPQHHTNLPLTLNSGEMFGRDVPPQMRPPPPPQFGQRPQRAPRPHLHFPPGLLRQRPDIHRFPPAPPGPLPARFTGTVKHTIGVGSEGPQENIQNMQNLQSIPNNAPNFIEEQQRHHGQRIQNMLMKPEPKNSSPEEISERSGEPSKETGDSSGATGSGDVDSNDTKVDKENNSKEKVETEMLMEAQPLKDESAKVDDQKDSQNKEEPIVPTNFPKGPRNLRLRRSITSLSDVIGVQGAFKVVSQVDLNFAMNPNSTSSTPTIVLRGKMQQGDPIYGICLPRVGFGVVFFGLGLATLVSILIAAFLAYAHYTVRDYKGQMNNLGENLPSHPSIQPLPYQFFPMVMLRKMW